MLVSAGDAHERNESRYRPDPGSLNGPVPGSQALLCSHEAQRDLGAVFRPQLKRGSQEVQEYDRESLRLSLMSFLTLRGGRHLELSVSLTRASPKGA